jgi:hypothetical protein
MYSKPKLHSIYSATGLLIGAVDDDAYESICVKLAGNLIHSTEYKNFLRYIGIEHSLWGASRFCIAIQPGYLISTVAT